MLDGFTSGLIWPAAALALLGWLVPRLLSLVWPEGVRALFALAFVSAGVMVMIGMAAFLLLYLIEGVPFSVLAEAGTGSMVAHFLRLGVISALFWGPILVLSVAGIPKTWVKETW